MVKLLFRTFACQFLVLHAVLQEGRRGEEGEKVLLNALRYGTVPAHCPSPLATKNVGNVSRFTSNSITNAITLLGTQIYVNWSQ